MRVATFLPDEDARTLVDALARSSAVENCSSVRQLKAALNEGTELVICDLPDGGGSALIDTLIGRAAETSMLKVVLRASLRNRSVQQIVSLVQSGVVVSVVLRDFDSLTEVSSGVAAGVVGSHSARSAILEEYARHVTEVDTAVVAAVALGFPRKSIAEFARSCGFSSRTLVRRLARHGLPPPSEQLAWSCCLHVVWLLEVSGWSTKNTAIAAGFSGTQALNHFVARHMGLAPVRLTRIEPFSKLVKRWLLAVAPVHARSDANRAVDASVAPEL